MEKTIIRCDLCGQKITQPVTILSDWFDVGIDICTKCRDELIGAAGLDAQEDRRVTASNYRRSVISALQTAWAEFEPVK